LGRHAPFRGPQGIRAVSGGGPLGVFQKWAILSPTSDKKFALSNLAITQAFTIGFAMYPGRFYGTESNDGILAGIPINKSCLPRACHHHFKPCEAFLDPFCLFFGLLP